MSTQDGLVAHLRRTSRELHTRTGVRDRAAALENIVSTAVVTVPGTRMAGLTLVDDRYTAPSGGLLGAAVSELDRLQGELDAGPAATALAESPADGTVLVEDFAGQDRYRWPEFAPHVLEAGYRSMVSVLLEVGGVPRGTLNLYGVQACAFDSTARRAAGLLAITVGTLLLGVEHVALLQRALESRDVIGRAKGVLMERFRLTEDEAYARLVDASQHANMKLVDVARWLERESRTRVGGRPVSLVAEPCL
jgi:hypothetical protein